LAVCGRSRAGSGPASGPSAAIAARIHRAAPVTTLTVPLATAAGPAGRPGEMAGIGPVDPDPEANTQDRYQIRASADPGYLAHQRAGPLPGRGRSLVCVTQ